MSLDPVLGLFECLAAGPAVMSIGGAAGAAIGDGPRRAAALHDVVHVLRPVARNAFTPLDALVTVLRVARGGDGKPPAPLRGVTEPVFRAVLARALEDGAPRGGDDGGGDACAAFAADAAARWRAAGGGGALAGVPASEAAFLQAYLSVPSLSVLLDAEDLLKRVFCAFSAGESAGDVGGWSDATAMDWRCASVFARASGLETLASTDAALLADAFAAAAGAASALQSSSTPGLDTIFPSSPSGARLRPLAIDAAAPTAGASASLLRTLSLTFAGFLEWLARCAAGATDAGYRRVLAVSGSLAGAAVSASLPRGAGRGAAEVVTALPSTASAAPAARAAGTPSLPDDLPSRLRAVLGVLALGPPVVPGAAGGDRRPGTARAFRVSDVLPPAGARTPATPSSARGAPRGALYRSYTPAAFPMAPPPGSAPGASRRHPRALGAAAAGGFAATGRQEIPGVAAAAAAAAATTDEQMAAALVAEAASTIDAMAVLAKELASEGDPFAAVRPLVLPVHVVAAPPPQHVRTQPPASQQQQAAGAGAGTQQGGGKTTNARPQSARGPTGGKAGAAEGAREARLDFTPREVRARVEFADTLRRAAVTGTRVVPVLAATRPPPRPVAAAAAASDVTAATPVGGGAPPAPSSAPLLAASGSAADAAFPDLTAVSLMALGVGGGARARGRAVGHPAGSGGFLEGSAGEESLFNAPAANAASRALLGGAAQPRLPWAGGAASGPRATGSSASIGAAAAAAVVAGAATVGGRALPDVPPALRPVLIRDGHPPLPLGGVPRVALARVLAGQRYHDMGNYRAAVGVYRETAVEWEAAAVAAGASAPGGIVRGGGAVGGPARRVYEGALPPEARVFLALAVGGAFESSGEDAAALGQYMDARVELRWLDHSHPYACAVHARLGALCYHGGQPRLAGAAFASAIDRTRRTVDGGGPGAPEAAAALAVAGHNLGCAAAVAGDAAEAAARIAAALGALTSLLGAAHPACDTARGNVARVRRLRATAAGAAGAWGGEAAATAAGGAISLRPDAARLRYGRPFVVAVTRGAALFGDEGKGRKKKAKKKGK